MMQQTALLILHPGFEEIEAICPIDLLVRADVEVVLASLDEALEVCGRSGIRLRANAPLKALSERPFDAIILPGGPGIAAIRQHPALCALLQKQEAAGKLIGCICAAPLLLKDAGLLQGRCYTAHPSSLAELPQASPDPVVQDGPIITSRGAGTAIEFALALVQNLTTPATAQSMADSICRPHSE